MDIETLLKRARPANAVQHRGEWATLFLRPDLGSQQEFLVGACAAFGDAPLLIEWVPSLSKLTKLYGGAIAMADLRSLIAGSERSLRSSFDGKLTECDTGTPQIRVQPCGFFAAESGNAALLDLLKRQALAIWQEPDHRESAANDEWAYSEMRKCLGHMQNLFVPGRRLQIGDRTLKVGLSTPNAFGDIVSARYSVIETVERHVKDAVIELTKARVLSNKPKPPGLFVVLQEPISVENKSIIEKTRQLLDECADMDILTCGDTEPRRLALQLTRWASA